MTTSTTTSIATPESRPTRWWARTLEETTAELGTNLETGLTAAEVEERRARFGPNTLTASAPPSLWSVVLQQVRDPMNLMLVAVAVISAAIGQGSTAVIVGFLVVLNVLIGARQEMQARKSVDALATMQEPQTRVRRDGVLVQIPAHDLVPGDVVELEAGDIVPADGRLVRTATMETQEAALTGESAPIGKDVTPLADDDVSLGDRANMAFQNTSVTRGTGTMLVTATGMTTQIGNIATLLSSVEKTKSPLQKELDRLTKVLGAIAWSAVAVIVVIGVLRGESASDLLFLATAVAISAIPTGLPTFVQAMLAYGARQLADAKAVVANLNDVETLGATSSINSDKTGTLTLNEMTVTALYTVGQHFVVEGSGYGKTGNILQAAGGTVPDLTPLAYGLVLASDATVSDSGDVIGDPTEAALVVLAAKIGVDAEESRRTYPRVASVPFDSAYKFMATAQWLPWRGDRTLVEVVKGGPDVVLQRCTRALAGPGEFVDLETMRPGIEAEMDRLAKQGLRTLAFAVRFLTPADEVPLVADPMSFVEDLVFVGLVGIVDPLRPTAKVAVEIALKAGIEVRMITGDHAVTASAIGAQLGLGPGAISGPELAKLTDEELLEQLPNLHVFGRVTPEDKLRLVQLMQKEGLVVAMTGDAVNDAAAIKQADIGVAMGSGSEVTKQAARLVLTDDNFSTLVHAVELGRSIYQKITAYIRFQMSQLIGLVLLFLAASIFDIASGVAMTPMMVLFLNFFVAVAPVIAIMLDPVGPGIMDRLPRDPNVGISNGKAVRRWILYGSVLCISSGIPLVLGPDTPDPNHATASMTMTFVVMGLGSIMSGLVLRREPDSGLAAPLLTAVKVLSVPTVLVILATELNFLQGWLTTQSLTGEQWLISICLALALPIVGELDKLIMRRRLAAPVVLAPQEAVSPARARV
ncbi:cation-transporting P-type ATPase [Cellulomonas sp. URHD0024]|uniref:cation-translocating P-type ATPase n=1 Tax=Cellulomonas sp. URHD0024 TaxID=1302620 RepID=UPI00040D3DCF|nr:cation-transporting P-type ATPase [Cellulomonas sp. URHD0024]